MAATPGEPAKDAGSKEHAALRAEIKKLKAESARLTCRNQKLTGELGKAKTALGVGQLRGHGTIPACAGSTERNAEPSRLGRDHPRVRGEHRGA